MPETPEAPSQPSPSKKRANKKKIKKESPPVAPTISKRTRTTLTSSEHPLNPKRIGATTRRLAQALTEASEVLEDDLPIVEDLLAGGETH